MTLLESVAVVLVGMTPEGSVTLPFAVLPDQTADDEAPRRQREFSTARFLEA